MKTEGWEYKGFSRPSAPSTPTGPNRRHHLPPLPLVTARVQTPAPRTPSLARVGGGVCSRRARAAPCRSLVGAGRAPPLAARPAASALRTERAALARLSRKRFPAARRAPGLPLPLSPPPPQSRRPRCRPERPPPPPVPRSARPHWGGHAPLPPPASAQEERGGPARGYSRAAPLQRSPSRRPRAEPRGWPGGRAGMQPPPEPSPQRSTVRGAGPGAGGGQREICWG